MKTTTIMKTLFAAGAAIAMTLTAQAAKTAKVVCEDKYYSGGSGVVPHRLRFVYDATDYGTEGADWYAVPETSPAANPPWFARRLTVTKVVFDDSFASYRPRHCGKWFTGFYKLETVEGIENLDTSRTTSFAAMFYNCKALEELDVSNFDTASATDLSQMFYKCELLESLDLVSFDTANVTEMSEMFYDCSALVTIYASAKFVTTKVSYAATGTDAHWKDMFLYCECLRGGYKTYYDGSAVNGTYACIDSKETPGYFTAKALPLTPKAVVEDGGKALRFVYDRKDHGTKGTDWFSVAEAEAVDPINHYDEIPWYALRAKVTNVVFDASFRDYRPTSCAAWFMDMTKLAGLENPENLDTFRVTSFCRTFSGCWNLATLDLSRCDTSKVKNTYQMFGCCYALTTIYASDGFVTSAVTSSDGMFSGCSSLVGGAGTEFSSSHTDATYARIDGGPSSETPGYFTAKDVPPEPKVVVEDAGKTLRFVYDNARYGERGTDWFSVDNKVSWYACRKSVTKVIFDDTFAAYKPTTCSGWFQYFSALTVIEDIENLDTSEVEAMSFMFYSCSSLTALDVSHFDTSKVEDMCWMFRCCLTLEELDVSGFDTSKVVSMEGMFDSCYALKTLDVSHFDTSKVEGMRDMFSGCSSLTALDVSNFDTSNVWSMQGMFSACSSLTTLDLSNFDTSKVEDMESMFLNCKALTSVDVSHFNTKRVTSMTMMFDGCKALMTLDLSSFDTSGIEYNSKSQRKMGDMFLNCEKLETIYASDAFAVRDSESFAMFDGCTSLVGGKGTAYDETKMDSTYAHLDGGEENPGYFSEKPKTVGQYLSKNLVDDLGVVIPSDVSYAAGDKVTVKVEGLAKGLKLVATPVYEDPLAKKKVIVDYDYTIEGVPTEAIGEENPMYARVTVTYKDKAKGKAETLQRIYLDIAAAEAAAFPETELKADYAASVKAIWPEADATWGFKGWPAGLKYTAKDVTKKNKDKSVTTNAVAFTVYGKPTKAGVFTITASHPKQVGKTKYTETETATLTVWGDDGATDFAQTDTCGTGVYRALDAKSVSGLPTGLKFAKGVVSGTPTKPGVYAVTVTANDKSKTTSLWKVETGANDGVMDGIAWTEGGHTLVTTDANGVSLMQGASCNWPVTVPSGAKGDGERAADGAQIRAGQEDEGVVRRGRADEGRE